MLDNPTVKSPGSADEAAARILIEQAGVTLYGRRNDIPPGFVAQLFGRVVADDVVHYGADDLAMLAEQAFDYLKQRAPGTSKIRCETVQLHASGERKAITVIEVTNDDMPFLVNSVMGEIADRRLDVRLVSHPVLGVGRDGDAMVDARRRRHRRQRARELHSHSCRADRLPRRAPLW